MILSSYLNQFSYSMTRIRVFFELMTDLNDPKNELIDFVVVLTETLLTTFKYFLFST